MERDSSAGFSGGRSSESPPVTPQADALSQLSSSKATSSSSKPVRYKNKTFMDACASGDLPLVVMLWDMAASRQTSVMVADADQNTPFHYAALAQTPEVLAFLYQKHRDNCSTTMGGFVEPDSRNAFGETPLLKSMSVGYPQVIRYLLDRGADLFAVDNNQSSVFVILAKFSHPWALNYVYRCAELKEGVANALALLAAEDKDGYSAIDWAADSGDVNVIEYLVRRGVDPLCSSSGKQRSLLALAVQSKRLHASIFLLASGCNPHAKERADGLSAYDIAKAKGFSEILPYIDQFSERFWHTRSQKRGFSCYTEIDEFGYSENVINPNHSRSSGRFRSHAVYRHNTPRISYSIFHSGLVFVAWLLTLCMPFYAWTFLGIVAAGLFARLQQQSRSADLPQERDRYVARFPSYLDLLLAPERLLGVWGGSVAAIVLYLASCSAAGCSSGDGYRYYGRSYGFAPEPSPDASPSPLGIAATSGGREDPVLLALCWATLGAAVLSWLCSVFRYTDAGCVDTRYADFDDCFNDSFLAAGAPPSFAEYCPTTLVKKPLRSKYCTHTGMVIARMDHYCVWLCNSVGYNNNGTFILFLVAHITALCCIAALLLRSLAREVGLRSGSAELLLGRLYFFPLLLCLFTLMTSLALARLLLLQMLNITKNITINEELNYSRYTYMSFSSSGRLETTFNNGALMNVLEFLQVGPHKIDYLTCFEAPGSSHIRAAKRESYAVMDQGSPMYGGEKCADINSGSTPIFTL